MYRTLPSEKNKKIFSLRKSSQHDYDSRLYAKKTLLATALGTMAFRASVEELLAAPKPGLVDPLHAGCHKDMTWALFMASANALAPYWAMQAGAGLDARGEPSAIMSELRRNGIAMERAMFECTEGVNTHKGLIFALSLLVAGAGIAIARGEPSPKSICAFASEIARRDIENENRLLSKETARTNGEKIFLACGVMGIRGEVLRGFDNVLSFGLPACERALEAGADRNDAALAALLALMEHCEDTNVIHRGGYDYWRNDYRVKTARAAKNFDPAQPASYEPLRELEEEFMKKNISPGGAADLLVCTLFLSHSNIYDNIIIKRGFSR